MRAYQCSRCTQLLDYDEYCTCRVVSDIRPGHREKGDLELCRKNFEPLEKERQWHEKFSWE